jgi:hypothetical protein
MRGGSVSMQDASVSRQAVSVSRQAVSVSNQDGSVSNQVGSVSRHGAGVSSHDARVSNLARSAPHRQFCVSTASGGLSKSIFCLIAEADLDEIQRFLLVNCVQTYLELTPGETAEYEALRDRKREKEVRAMEMNWVDRLETQYLNAGRREGREEGRQEGRKEGQKEGREPGRLEGARQLLLRLMALRFGPLPETLRAQVEAVSSLARLNRLAEKVVVAQSLEEMGLG